MIDTRTTLILGAGASMPYGMPSGADLRSMICTQQENLSEVLYKKFLIAKDVTLGFADAFLRSNVASIDSFLAKRSNYMEIGKLCIAFILCSKENPNEMFTHDNDDHWYFYLWQKLFDDVQQPTDLYKNNIRFITFNYDRSLEYFLHQSIKHTFGLSDHEALDILNKLEILHIYGLLGNFHYKNTNGSRSYSCDFSIEQIHAAAKGINVIPESREDSDTFIVANKWLEESEKIGFLGFGFDALNIKRLGLNRVLKLCLDNNKPVPSITASAFRTTDSERNKISGLIYPSYSSHIHFYDAKNTDVLRESNLLG